MEPSFLLPNRFKKVGIFFFPIGIIVWVLTQRGLFSTDLNHQMKVLILTLSFFSFLFGLYFITFSKEPIEDEYIKLDAEKNTLNPIALKIRQESIMSMEQRAQQEQMKWQQRLQDREQEYLQPILDRLQKAIETVAETGALEKP